MKKVLFLLGSYLPNPSANGICADKVIQELVKTGSEVTCIAYSEHTLKSYEVIDQVSIYRLNRGYLDRLLSKYASLNKNAPRRRQFIELLKKVNQILLLPFYPWINIVYTFKLLFKSLALQKEHDFDAVVCVHVPMDTLIVGTILKRKNPNIKYIGYFLDSLSGGFPLRILPAKWALRRRLKWEAVLLKNADLCVMMGSSKNHYETHWKGMSHENKTVFLDIPLLSEPKLTNESFEESLLEKDKINIVYTGTLFSSSRNPEYLIDLLTKLDRSDIALTFIGGNDCAKLIKEKEKNFKGSLKIVEHLSHGVITSILPKADILLNIGVNNQNAISGKIFEYMSYGKPIISTYSIDDEACIPYLNQYEDSLLIDQRLSLEVNLEKLKTFLAQHSGDNKAYSEVEKLFYNNTPKAFVKEFSKL